MTATITADNGAGSTTPHFILVPYMAELSGRNVVHDLIGGGIAVSLVPPRPRSGDLDLLYLTEADAFAAVDLHGHASTFTLTETDRPHLNMSYVLTNSARIRLEEDASTWIVTVSFQEVTP